MNIQSFAEKKTQASCLNRLAYKQPIFTSKQDMLSGMAEKSQNGLALPYMYHYDQTRHNEPVCFYNPLSYIIKTI